MKKGLTLLVFIMDRSGSMAQIITDSIGGFNTLIEQQKEACEAEGNSCKVTLTTFDDQKEVVYNYVDINDVTPLTTKTFYAGGWTALIDATCSTINEVGKTLADLPEEERPEKVLVTIITDGQENSSREFNKVQMKEMIKHQEDTYQWVFNFIGANIDSMRTGASYGMGMKGTSNYKADPKGVRAMFAGLSNYTTNLRNATSVGAVVNDLSHEISQEESK